MDVSINFDAASTFPTALVARQIVLAFIEETFSKILEELQIRPYGRPCITLRRITALRPLTEGLGTAFTWNISYRDVIYGFPGKNKDEAWRFGKLIGDMLIPS